MPEWWLEDTSGVLHKASFTRLTIADTKRLRVSSGWSAGVSWKRELDRSGSLVFKLVDVATETIQGVISMNDQVDHVYVNFIESAPHNRFDPRAFVNIARLLIAFAGLRSIEIGADGFIALTPKTGLETYYREQFKAFPLLNRNVGIADVVTKYWIRVYYK